MERVKIFADTPSILSEWVFGWSPKLLKGMAGQFLDPTKVQACPGVTVPGDNLSRDQGQYVAFVNDSLFRMNPLRLAQKLPIETYHAFALRQSSEPSGGRLCPGHQLAFHPRVTRLRRPRSRCRLSPVSKEADSIGGRCGRCRGSLSARRSCYSGYGEDRGQVRLQEEWIRGRNQWGDHHGQHSPHRRQLHREQLRCGGNRSAEHSDVLHAAF